MPQDIAKNLKVIHHTIAQALSRLPEPHQAVTLLAVSKRQSIEKIQAAVKAGCMHFGENQVQEALSKIITLDNPQLTWHFIGTIQSNKTQQIAAHFHWVHSLCNLKHSKRLNEQRQGLPPLNVCVAVNIDQEPTKTGLNPKDIAQFLSDVAHYSNLKLRGLMCIPKPGHSEAAFNHMQNLFSQLKKQGFPLDTLSMGMSDDYTDAIQHGATMVRIGSAIFGPRA